ncbi:hypothetical protein FRACYDRAFT_251534 [Fragilariopsis cylindrus CCMP1102]|uniref:Uncharacterized protein n=1 Tax=Fragilariopsis cylindrus CCMP1102 TaxID=635003 RepID=A0A1E7EMM4_9STRA|nr:hypothetical protein FRACYDRAFT_251534 [Fragilariopsis cylindrus CCMP1102]|eukprot:OEU07202.1 hypothetical protein FRACYDRAFT_251534 [Fragilariopsis cylindrus CCMP1102]
MHHQYRSNNLERLYGAQHYTYRYKVQLLLRAVPSAPVVKAMMHHQYRSNNLERLYGAQHYTYRYKVQLLLRAAGRLGRCQGGLQNRGLESVVAFIPLWPVVVESGGLNTYPCPCNVGGGQNFSRHFIHTLYFNVGDYRLANLVLLYGVPA